MAHLIVTVLFMLVIAATVLLAVTGHYWLLGFMLLGALAQLGDQVFFHKRR